MLCCVVLSWVELSLFDRRRVCLHLCIYQSGHQSAAWLTYHGHSFGECKSHSGSRTLEQPATSQLVWFGSRFVVKDSSRVGQSHFDTGLAIWARCESLVACGLWLVGKPTRLAKLACQASLLANQPSNWIRRAAQCGCLLDFGSRFLPSDAFLYLSRVVLVPVPVSIDALALVFQRSDFRIHLWIHLMFISCWLGRESIWQSKLISRRKVEANESGASGSQR